MKKTTSLLCALALLLSLGGCGDTTSTTGATTFLPEAENDVIFTVIPEHEDAEIVMQEETATSPENSDITIEIVSPSNHAEFSEEASAPIEAPDVTMESEQALQDTTDSETELAYVPTEGEYYYDPENVVLYLEYYGELPENYITKNEARDLGWSGGSVEHYLDGAAIGGDTFGNREGILPKASGRRYTECDLYTDGENSRGAYRLVFSNDGLYFYTEDHYESFTELWVEDGEVVWE